jgi:hypothetical protein
MADWMTEPNAAANFQARYIWALNNKYRDLTKDLPTEKPREAERKVFRGSDFSDLCPACGIGFVWHMKGLIDHYMCSYCDTDLKERIYPIKNMKKQQEKQHQAALKMRKQPQEA